MLLVVEGSERTLELVESMCVHLSRKLGCR